MLLQNFPYYGVVLAGKSEPVSWCVAALVAAAAAVATATATATCLLAVISCFRKFYQGAAWGF